MDRMKFGKHKGTPVREVPTEYLDWCIATMPDPPDYVLREAAERGVPGAISAMLYTVDKVAPKRRRR
jgi:hypothetical protein